MIIKWWRGRRKTCELGKRENLLDAIEIENKKLNDKQRIMLSKPCAINDMRLCQNDCVHFSSGKVFVMDDAYGGEVPVMISPRCKLWKE